MSTPTYVIKKVGDQYIPVAQDTCPGVRAAWIAGGAGLGIFGWRRGGVLGGLAALAGAGLIVRGVLGYNPLDLCCAKDGDRDGAPHDSPSFQNDSKNRSSQVPKDVVDEQLMESFPASDPPASTRTTVS